MFQISYFVLELTTTACWNIFHEVPSLLPISYCSLLFHISSKLLSLGWITCDFHHFCVWCNWISKLHSHKSDGGHRMFSISLQDRLDGLMSPSHKLQRKEENNAGLSTGILNCSWETYKEIICVNILLLFEKFMDWFNNYENIFLTNYLS